MTRSEAPAARRRRVAQRRPAGMQAIDERLWRRIERAVRELDAMQRQAKWQAASACEAD